MDCVPSGDSLKVLRILENGRWVILRSNDELLIPGGDSSTLRLENDTVPVTPELEMIAEDRMLLVDVIKDDGLLSLITAPPFVGELRVEAILTISISGVPGLARSGLSPDPDAS